jgi:indolepyruvate ferredoxin oxidoreductase beta subunit
MRSYNILIVGVGGQGLLTLGSIIGVACTIRGLDVAVAEVHGMSQRGGSVVIYVRIGEEPSPIMPVGSADHMLALELIEAARHIHHVRRMGYVTVNDFLWPPPLSVYPSRDQLISEVKTRDIKLHVVDANNMSVKITGSPISANIAILGYALGVDEFLRGLLGLDVIEKSLEEHFRGRALELNKSLLRIAFEEGLKRGE